MPILFFGVYGLGCCPDPNVPGIMQLEIVLDKKRLLIENLCQRVRVSEYVQTGEKFACGFKAARTCEQRGKRADFQLCVGLRVGAFDG